MAAERNDEHRVLGHGNEIDRGDIRIPPPPSRQRLKSHMRAVGNGELRLQGDADLADLQRLAQRIGDGPAPLHAVAQ